MPAAIFKGAKVKTLKDTFTVNDKYDLITGDSDDPTVVAKDAILGSEYVKFDTGEKFVKLDNGSTTNWKLIGSDLNGGINYVKNSQAESSDDFHTAYDDGAVAIPVDGDGGTPTVVSVSRTTTVAEILRGDASFKYSKTAADGQGEGIHIELEPIDSRDLGQRLQASFDFKMLDANYADGDCKIFVYDVDNAVLIGALENDDGGDLLAHTGNGATFVGFFNATDSLNYRLLVHQATTNATAVDFVYDNASLGPVGFVPVTTQYSEIIDLTGSGNFTGGSIKVERVGNIVSIQAITALTFTSSAGPNSAVGILPEWARPDVDSYNLPVYSGSSYILRVRVTPLGGIALFFNNFSGVAAPQTTDGVLSAITYPVSGQTNLVSNTELTQKTIQAQIHPAGNQSITTTAVTTILFDTVAYDSHGLADLGNNGYTITKAQYYDINCVINATSVIASDQIISRVLVNGSQILRNVSRSESSDVCLPMRKTVFLNVGDLVTVTTQTSSDALYTIRGGISDSYLEIKSVTDFTSYGVTGEKNKIQTKILLAPNVTTNGAIAGLTFSNLVTGSWYELNGRFALNVNDTVVDTTVEIQVTHNGSIIDTAIFRSNDGTTSRDFAYLSLSTKFQASASTVTFVANSASVNSYIAADGTRANTYVQIEERKDLVETSEF